MAARVDESTLRWRVGRLVGGFGGLDGLGGFGGLDGTVVSGWGGELRQDRDGVGWV